MTPVKKSSQTTSNDETSGYSPTPLQHEQSHYSFSPENEKVGNHYDTSPEK